MSDDIFGDLNAGMPTQRNGTLRCPRSPCASASVARARIPWSSVSDRGCLAHVADPHLLAVVGAEHDDDRGRLLGLDQRLDLVRPVVDIVAHETRRAVAAVDDLDAGVLGKGGRSGLRRGRRP